MYDVIIVGGGAAGLVAAKILSAAGKKILLLEAREHLGGRIQQVEVSREAAEAGAEFIHGNLKATFAILREAGLKKERIKGHFCKVAKGKWEVNNEIVPYWDLLLKRMKDCEVDMSIHDFLQSYFYAKKYEVLRKRFTKYVEGYDAADATNTSVFAIRKEMEGEDEPQYRPRPNYSAVIDFFKKTILEYKATIKTGEPVLQLIRGENIEVITASAKYTSRKVLIAVPLGVLQRRKNQAGAITFPSCLSGHISAAKRMGYGGVIKFLFEFDEAFWLNKRFLEKKGVPPPSYIFTDTKIPTWWTQYPSKSPLFVGWLAGPNSYKMKNYSERKLKKIALDALSSFFSMPVEALEYRLKAAKIVNWIKEPYIFGGYSYPTLETEKARTFINQPVENYFYFTGEYMAKDSSSTVDAALQSGKEVAERILKDE